MLEFDESMRKELGEQMLKAFNASAEEIHKESRRLKRKIILLASIAIIGLLVIGYVLGKLF